MKDKMTILVLDSNSYYYNKIVNVYLEPWNNYPSKLPFGTRTKELVWKIENTGDDWFWKEELLEGVTYIEITDRIKKLLAFL